MDNDKVEVKALAKFSSTIVGAKRRDDRFSTTRAYARHLCDLGLVQVLAAPAPANKPAGPGEKKPAGPSEQKGGAGGKKSFGAPTAGRSIDSPSSSAPGLVSASSFLAAGLASLKAMASRAFAPGAIETAVRSLSLP